MTTEKTIALTRRTFVGKVMSLLCNMLSRLVAAVLPRSKHILISWLQSPSAVILEPKKSLSLFPLSPRLLAMRRWDRTEFSSLSVASWHSPACVLSECSPRETIYSVQDICPAPVWWDVLQQMHCRVFRFWGATPHGKWDLLVLWPEIKPVSPRIWSVES